MFGSKKSGTVLWNGSLASGRGGSFVRPKIGKRGDSGGRNGFGSVIGP